MTQIKNNLKELENTFKTLRSKLDELNQDSVRDKKYDFQLMNENWLNQVLKSNIKFREKKRLLLIQTGYLRINIFTETLERVNILREKNQLDKAVQLMNNYAEIASLFISTKKQSALIKRLKGLLSIKRTDPIEYLQKWRTAYDAWVKQDSSQQPTDDEKRIEEFNQLRTLFIELYTFSFSVDNFPPLRNRRSDS